MNEQIVMPHPDPVTSSLFGRVIYRTGLIIIIPNPHMTFLTRKSVYLFLKKAVQIFMDYVRYGTYRYIL
jgi:hypothetical protein